MVVEFT